MHPKIVLIANCQARPISSILRNHYNAIVDEPIIVHLAKDDDAAECLSILNSADYIISQFISKTYPCNFVRSESIKEKFGEKVILIPNLYYRGYNPDLRGIRLKGKGVLSGPLGDYHSQIFVDAWLRNDSPLEALQHYNSMTYWRDHYGDVASKSLEELKRRESDLDIKITNFIRRHQADKHLFYTYNHPSRVLLLRLVKRIAKRLGLEPNDTIADNNREPLGRLRAPIHPFTQHQLGLTFKGPDQYQGNDPDQPMSHFEYYSPEKMIEAFFKLYNQHAEDIGQYALNINRIV